MENQIQDLNEKSLFRIEIFYFIASVKNKKYNQTFQAYSLIMNT